MKARTRLVALTLLGASGWGWLACGGGGGGGSSSSDYGGGGGNTPPANTIWVGNGGTTFTPATLTVTHGTMVTFVWKSSGHTVTQGNPCTAAASPKFDSGGVQSAGFTLTWTPNASDVGTVPYFCTPHCGAGMTGTITVN